MAAFDKMASLAGYITCLLYMSSLTPYEFQIDRIRWHMFPEVRIGIISQRRFRVCAAECVGNPTVKSINMSLKNFNFSQELQKYYNFSSSLFP